MSKKRKKPASASLPTHPSSTISEDRLEQELGAALVAEDLPRALEVLDAIPRWMRKEPELMLARATVLLSLGDEQEALRLMHEIERKNPRFTAIYLPLALFYIDHDWPAHALQAAQRALADRDLADEDRAITEKIIEEATGFLARHAEAFGLPFESIQRAGILDEKAQMALDEDKFSEAAYFAAEAIKLAPDWNALHNNRAQALYFAGKTAEAIATVEGVLERDPANVFAMSSLVVYHAGLNQLEQARAYAGRLAEQSQNLTRDSMGVEHVIKALALVEDTPALWKIARRYLSAPVDALYDRSWHALAVAAIRSGKWKEALTLMEKISEEGLYPAAKNLLDELRTNMGRRQPGLAWMPPPYPGIDLYLNAKVMGEWEALLKNFSSPLSPSQKRKFEHFFQKYPYLLAVMKRMLWEPDTHLIALDLLVQMDIPEADAEILAFALSQTGDRQTRLEALLQLIQAGRYSGPKWVKLWDEDRAAWSDIELNTQRVGDVEANARPQTLALIEKARKAKDPQAAIALLRQAVESEPTCPIALFNLGVMLVQTGETEEGEALIHRSVVVDPDYTYGHASIALSEAENGHEQEALNHLQVVTRAEVIAPDTAVMASLAWAVLAIEKHDLETARRRLEVAAQIAPDHRLLAYYQKMLKAAEDFKERFGDIFEYQHKSIQRHHQKLLRTPLTAEMGLRACLESYNKDMLTGSARFWGTVAYGKKGVLFSRLADRLLDPGAFNQTLAQSLGEKEREALRWLLEEDGVRPWQDFVQQYGDDLDESTTWDYHEPESIPGRLRRAGLLFAGTLAGQQVAFIPADLRPQLRKLLG